MSQIIKQPDGKLALWSSHIDDFVMVNADRTDIIEYEVEKRREEVTQSVNKVMKKLDAGMPAYYQFTKTWDEAMARRKEVHGIDADPRNEEPS